MDVYTESNIEWLIGPYKHQNRNTHHIYDESVYCILLHRYNFSSTDFKQRYEQQ